MLDKILYIVDTVIRHCNYCNFLSHLLKIGVMIDSFHSAGNCSLFQIELISLRISERIVLLPTVITSAGIWSVPGDLCLFSPAIAISNSKALGSDSCGSAVCISVCLTSLNPMYGENFPPPSQNTVGV